MQGTQTIIVNVVNAPIISPSPSPTVPGVPATGFLGSIGGWPVVLLAVVVVLAVLGVIFLVKKQRGLGVLSFMACLGLALAVNASPVFATSALTLQQPAIEFTVVKDDVQATTRTATSATSVTTDNATGYVMSVGLQAVPPAGITATLDDEDLTTTAADVYDDATGDSPSDYDHNLSVTVPASTPAGQYVFYIDYTIAENAPTTPTTLQEMTPAYCQYMPVGEVIRLRDVRNNQEYRVRKMPDNKCWIIDNMKIAGRTLTSADSDLPAGTTFVIPSNAITAASNRNSNGRCDGGSKSGTAGQLTCNGTTTASLANLSFAGFVNPESNNYCKTTGAAFTATGSTTGCGYLYNWYTATAGTGVYGTAFGTQAAGSICPAGFRLPAATAGASGPGNGTSMTFGDFTVLNASMNAGRPTNGSESNYYANWLPGGPFQGVYSGRWLTSLERQSTYGYLWSSTAGNNGTSQARFAYFISTNIYTGGNNGNLYDGYGVRCVLR